MLNFGAAYPPDGSELEMVIDRMLTVLIPTYRRTDLLKRTLSSLRAAKLPASYRELVVVENGSRGEAESLVASLPARLRARYLHYPRGNKSAALNYALEGIRNDLVVLLDDDVRVDPGLLDAYESAAGRQSSGVFFGGPFGVDYVVEPPDWLILPPSVRGWSLPEGTLTIDRPDFFGCNWAAFSEDLKRAGGFDADVGPGGTSGGRGQEVDMQKRLLEMGFRAMYVPDAFVWHFVPPERSSKEWSLERNYQNAITRGLVYQGKAARIFGYPRWGIKAIALKWIVAACSVRRSEEGRYRAWWDYYTTRGFVEGARFAYKRKTRSLRR